MASVPKLRTAVPLLTTAAVAAAAFGVACASSSGGSASSGQMMSVTLAGTPAPTYTNAAPPSPDARVGLKAGRMDSTRKVMLDRAGEASWNLDLVSNTPATQTFRGVTNSDLAFYGTYAIQGNYDGFQVWDISNPRSPTLKTYFLCPASQSDVSVWKNLLFVSAEAPSARLDCGMQGDTTAVSPERIRGIRIFDISDIGHPKYLTNVQTCRGSHTHTVVEDPKDKDNIYIYISGSSGVRPEGELRGCSDLDPANNPTSSNFRIEVIKVPLANPSQARLVSAPHIFADLTAPPRAEVRVEQDSVERAAALAARGGGGRGGRGGGRGGRGGGRGGPQIRQGPTQCHDITVYPAIGLAGGACGGYGLLLDIRDAANPKRVAAVADSNFSFWHSATFSNDGSKILFTDEWGGGSAPRCRSTDKTEWGADAIFSVSNDQLSFKHYYKMPAAQTSLENCVAHNGSLIPIPGREVMVQGWYQGGVSVFDWSDPSHPMEIAYFDRGPLDSGRLVSGGSWSAYWYNGLIVSSEISRGLDIFELPPSPYLSRNELDAAKTVRFQYLNVQDQQKLVWPPSFPLSRAYLDQLERNGGLAADKIAGARAALGTAESASGAARQSALTQLASQLADDASSARDAARVRLLANSVKDLAK